MDLIIKKNRKNVGENIVDSKYAKSYKVLKALCTLSHALSYWGHQTLVK